MYFFDIKAFFLTIGAHPATLAFQIAVVGYRDELKCREKLSFLLPSFEFPKAQKTFPNHICDEFVPATAICFHKIAEKRHCLTVSPNVD
jgi:hypothetical protein